MYNNAVNIRGAFCFLLNYRMAIFLLSSGREHQGWRGRLLSSSGRHCGREPENPSLTETLREAFAERLSRS